MIFRIEHFLMSNNLSGKNTLPTQKLLLYYKKTLNLQLPPFWKFKTHPNVPSLQVSDLGSGILCHVQEKL